MIRLKFLIALLIGTFSYTLVSFLVGQNGIYSYKQLSEQKKQIALCTNEIENTNSVLNLEYNALLNDRDLIASYARKLDYVKDGERLVKITGLSPRLNVLFDVGTVTRRKKCEYISEKNCKIFGITCFFISLILLMLTEVKNMRNYIERTREPIIKGVPIYEFEQI